ncbi:MAG: ACP S-malonyltransferase [Deltaproteobacteria bacterium]|nr:ACP S-malonyltransferase [Deltaproteobacteria bacterium]
MSLQYAAAVVFPGQGSQRIGMGRDIHDAYRECRRVFERASDALRLDMRALCFAQNDMLAMTEFTQPAILTVEIAIYEVLKEQYGFLPRYFAGHSLGEYAALVAADVLPFEVALLIARKRGELMQRAVPAGEGAMAAIIAEEIPYEDLQESCRHNGCEIANYNSPQQAVISGMAKNVDAAMTAFQYSLPAARAVMLDVSAPFHSSLMRPAEIEFSRQLEHYRHHFNYQNAQQVLSNYTGVFHSGLTLRSSMTGQISGAVRWIENMHALIGVAGEILEVGPQRVLSRFFRSVGKEVSCISDLRSLEKVFRQELAHGQ